MDFVASGALAGADFAAGAVLPDFFALVVLRADFFAAGAGDLLTTDSFAADGVVVSGAGDAGATGDTEPLLLDGPTTPMLSKSAGGVPGRPPRPRGPLTPR